MRVQSMGEMEKDFFCPNAVQPFLEMTEAGSLLQYFTTLSFRGDLHLGVPCKGALLGRVEWEEVWINIQRPVNIF